MSAERWVKVDAGQRDILAERGARSRVNRQVAEAFDAAEGQRVEEIRWCDTHDERAWPSEFDHIKRCNVGRDQFEDCVIVDATLILPPKDAA